MESPTNETMADKDKLLEAIDSLRRGWKTTAYIGIPSAAVLGWYASKRKMENDLANQGIYLPKTAADRDHDGKPDNQEIHGELPKNFKGTHKQALKLLKKQAEQSPYSPKSLKFGKTLKEKIHKTSTRNKLLEKYGPNAFLMPEEKKFPIVNPNTGKISCKLLKAAKIRAAQHGYASVLQKANKLMEQHCGMSKTASLVELNPYEKTAFISALAARAMPLMKSIAKPLLKLPGANKVVDKTKDLYSQYKNHPYMQTAKKYAPYAGVGLGGYVLGKVSSKPQQPYGA